MRNVDEIEKKLEEAYKKRDLLNKHSQQVKIRFPSVEISFLKWLIFTKK